uniref:DM13 domain-containing protein n=1 Tax=Panagrolaimus superbus TaxID=310955 RepID=A0A914YE09_9BILA
MWRAVTAVITLLTVSFALEFNDYDSQYGTFMGELSNLGDGEVQGNVYVINETAIQLVNFTYNGNGPVIANNEIINFWLVADVYFWLDRTESPTKEGLKVPSLEFGVAPLKKYDNAQVVLALPGAHKVSTFKSFSLYCLNFDHNFGSVEIKEGLVIPRPQFLTNELHGSRYNVGSGPILIMDRRTIKVFGFTFDGDKAPDGYFFVGRGPNVVFDAGVKVPIRGRDSSEMVTAMNERYRGGQDIIIDLPEEYDINHIDWLAIYCYKFRVDFGHVSISNVSQRIPPFISLPADDYKNIDGWQITTLLGTPKRHNFTFQLGVPGGKRGYQYMAHARPGNYVWYVNGYLADLYLRRNVTYTFVVQGGSDKSTSDFYNPLYISDDSFGGYMKLSNDEKEQVHILAGNNPDETTGNLCMWIQQNVDDNPDSYNSFAEYRKTLKLKCDENIPPAVFMFTPNASTPDVIYYQSYSNYNMGYKIHIVDDLPEDLEDFVEEPYQYEAWLKHHNLQLIPRGANTAPKTSYNYFAFILVIAFAFL